MSLFASLASATALLTRRRPSDAHFEWHFSRSCGQEGTPLSSQPFFSGLWSAPDRIFQRRGVRAVGSVGLCELFASLQFFSFKQFPKPQQQR